MNGFPAFHSLKDLRELLRIFSDTLKKKTQKVKQITASVNYICQERMPSGQIQS